MESGIDGDGEVVERIAPLLQASRDHREQRFDESTAFGTFGSQTRVSARSPPVATPARQRC